MNNIEERSKEFAKNFMSNNNFLFRDDNIYIDDNLLAGRRFNKNKDGVAYGIFINRIKSCYEYFVIDNIMSEEELNESLAILVTTDSLFTIDNVVSIHQAIKAGFYDEELEKYKETIEFEQLDWGDEDWG